MEQRYVYVDYENMGNIKELVPINGKYFCFIGSNQKKLSANLVFATEEISVKEISVKWISIEGSGKNALDFHIAYYLGVQSSEENITHYILSKDKGMILLLLLSIKNIRKLCQGKFIFSV